MSAKTIAADVASSRHDEAALAARKGHHADLASSVPRVPHGRADLEKQRLICGAQSASLAGIRLRRPRTIALPSVPAPAPSGRP